MVARGGGVGVAAVAIVAVGASRVLLGLHFVTDVLGGALLGAATALALTPLVISQPSRDMPGAKSGPPPDRHPHHDV